MNSRNNRPKKVMTKELLLLRFVLEFPNCCCSWQVTTAGW